MADIMRKKEVSKIKNILKIYLIGIKFKKIIEFRPNSI